MATLVERQIEVHNTHAAAGVVSGSRIETGVQVQACGTFLLRYGLVLVLGWIGAMKFTAFEAEGIRPLVENSPLMSWAYAILSVQGFSNLLGTTEIVMAILIALRPVSAKLAAIGSGLAALTFLTTLSFLFSTPGWEPSLGGFPAISMVGGFLLKDIVLLGAAVWLLGDALKDLMKFDDQNR
jgi:uncharacterized membrane protein YkgB